eukprot:GEZU01013595.1.p1 GENE.GEZU01013595.1~~GEZU01013595.1.p1  ORF type:complete len:420 (-),score=118.93 GEZU01013595.1:90-1349(-)
MSSKNKLRIAFIHPDLGIGGAERLVVDAAVGLQKRGHSLSMFTSHHNKDHCFEETKDGTLSVEVFGDWLPRHILGRFHIVFATLRMLIVTLCVLFKYKDAFDVYIVDQLSTPLPLIRLLASKKARILFYCHFPDKLCVSDESKSSNNPILWILKRGYRFVFDWIEEHTMGKAHRILFNSKFTLSVTRDTFPSLAARTNEREDVLYPALNLQSYDVVPSGKPKISLSGKKAIVSINRFERKKNIGLALEAYSLLQNKVPKDVAQSLCLVIAGGYDERLQENREYLQELKQLAQKLGIAEQTTFLPSFSDADRYVLLHESSVVVYTPTGEHFGIVPIEAMYCERCVVAANMAGPTESVKSGETGILTDPDPEHFADAIAQLLTTDTTSMRKAARKHVQDRFSLEAFSQRLEQVLYEITTSA